MAMQTDMALEAAARCGDVPGVTQRRERVRGVEITRVCIETPQAAEKLDKPIGRYVTAERGDGAGGEAFSAVLADELRAMLQGVDGHVLVVGLGNRFVTPDALGPRTVDGLYVTRHIRAFAPELAPAGMRDVSAVAPGVLGVTGLETAEVVAALTARVQPKALLLIDALVSLRADRIGRTVQMNDSGLLPGAGVHNRQKGIDRGALGIPVFAVGVPTVVHAETIARETARLLAARTGVAGGEGALADMAASLIGSLTGEMVVTPKDVDKLVADAARQLARAINLALHGALCRELSEILEF